MIHCKNLHFCLKSNCFLGGPKIHFRDLAWFGAPGPQLTSPRLSSARLGSARLGSAQLSSVGLCLVRLRSAHVASAWPALGRFGTARLSSNEFWGPGSEFFLAKRSYTIASLGEMYALRVGFFHEF